MRAIVRFAIDFPYVGMLRNEVENERESRVEKGLQACNIPICIITHPRYCNNAHIELFKNIYNNFMLIDKY